MLILYPSYGSETRWKYLHTNLRKQIFGDKKIKWQIFFRFTFSMFMCVRLFGKVSNAYNWNCWPKCLSFVVWNSIVAFYIKLHSHPQYSFPRCFLFIIWWWKLKVFSFRLIISLSALHPFHLLFCEQKLEREPHTSGIICHVIVDLYEKRFIFKLNLRNMLCRSGVNDVTAFEFQWFSEIEYRKQYLPFSTIINLCIYIWLSFIPILLFWISKYSANGMYCIPYIK